MDIYGYLWYIHIYGYFYMDIIKNMDIFYFCYIIFGKEYQFFPSTHTHTYYRY